jgi:hypothetical protein
MKKIITLLFFVTVLIQTSAQSNINWGMGMNVSNNSYSNMHPRIVMNAAGNPLVIWGRMSDQRLFLSRWNGSSFGTPVNISGNLTIATAGWQGPDIAAKGDTIYVVMKETPEADTSSHVYLIRSFNGGATFSAPTRVDYIGDSICRFPTVTIDASGNPIVAFMKFNTNFGEARWVVCKSTNYGSSFSMDTKASGWSGMNAECCDCCPGGIVSSGNNVAMIYRDKYSNMRDNWVGMSSNGGASFTNGWNIDQNNWMIMMCPSSGPDGVVIGDTLYSTFMNAGSGNEVVYYSATSLSTSSTAPTRPLTATIPATFQNYPRIDKKGSALAVVWKQNVNGQDQLPIRFTTNMNAGLPTMYDTVDLGDIANADVVVGNGTIFVVWQDDNSGTVKYRSGTFTPFNSVGDLPSEQNIFSVYPNPASGSFTVEMKNQGKAEFDLVNAIGQVVTSGSINGKTKVDLSNLSSGAYFIRVTTQTGVYSQKIIRQ